MSLRVKALLSSIIALLGLVAVSYVALQMILPSSFARLEEQTMRENSARTLDALSVELAQLESAASDWARWDDTYAFIEDANAQYVASNLSDAAFANLKLNVMVFVHSSGRVVIGKGYDLEKQKEMPVPSNLYRQLTNDNFLLNHPDTHSVKTGIVSLPEGPLLVSALPILTSQEQGPIRGTLLFGRFLDAAEIARLAQTTHLTLALRRLDDPEMPAAWKDASAALSEQTPVVVRPLNEQTVVGYALVQDIYGKPALILSTETAREIYRQGQVSATYLMWALVVIGVAFAGIVFIVVERLFLTRITGLSQDVQQIGARGDPARRVSAHGGDEISSLAGEINRMLDAFQTSEQRYRALFEGAPTIIYALDTAGQFTALNPAFERVTGWKCADWLGRSFTEIIPPEDLPETTQMFQRALRGDRLDYAEWRIVSATGAILTIELLGLSQTIEGKIVGVTGFARDITERKRTEEALRESEERYRDLVEHSHALICTHDLQGRLLSANQWAVQQLGYENIPVSQMNLRDLLAPEVRDQADEYLARIQCNGVAHGVMLVQIRTGEKRLWEYHNTLRTEGVAAPIVRGIAYDITEQKHLERALRESEERWRAYIEQANDLIFALDASGRMALANRALCSTLGYTAEELVGKSPLEFIAPEARAAATVALTRVFSGEEVERFEAEALTRDQRRIALEIRGRTFRKDGQIAGTFHIARDVTERKRAEDVLRASEEKYRQLFENASIGIFHSSPEGRFLSVNPAAARMFGYASPEEMVALVTDISTQIYVDSRRRGDLLTTTLEQSDWVYAENRYRRKDGDIITANLAVRKVLDANGAVAYLEGLVEDITERKRAEEELRRSQKEWQDIFNAINHPTFILDPQHGISAANPAVLKQLGKPEAEVIGRKCYHLFHNTECSPLGCPMETMVRSGKTETVEMEMRAAGGTYLVSCTPVLDEQGNLEKVIHIATNITARKRAEDELAQSHSLLKAAFDSTADGLLVVDGKGKITQSNRKFAEMWRIAPELVATGEDDKALTFVLEQLSEPDDFIRKVRELYAQPNAESFDALRFKDGRMFERFSQPQYLGKQIVGRVWSFRDVTARQQAQVVLKEYSERQEQMVEARTRELRDAQEQLVRQERLAVLGQLAGGIAHELRSPLSAIKNAAYYFKMVVENPSPDAREMMDILDQQIDVSARIISSLLDFAGPKTPTLQTAQLARVIEAAICQCTIPQNIVVVWQADESLPSIKVDAEQMQLVFSNLITNAAQAMPQGGQLTIAVQPVENEMRVTISDTGVGIPAEALDKVFQPLYTTKAKGIGLGLALSRIIVEAHGGAITVTSEVGKGTTFFVSLPRLGERDVG